MNTVTYPEPVNKLLTFGEPDPGGPESWPNYIEAVGLGPEHIPDLIRMAVDRKLRDIKGEDEEEGDISYTAPVHALRAVGQLKAQEAIQPLVDLLPELEDDEWMQEDIPHVLAMIGPVSLPALAAYVADESHETYSRAFASNGLVEIAQKYPEHRAESIAALSKPLEADHDEELNGFLIGDLITLKALEATPVMEQAFAEDRVDLSIAGDWDEVQVALGLKERSEVPERRWNNLETLFSPQPALPRHDEKTSLTADGDSEPRKHHSNKKAKEKMAKQSRKKNRRKKK